MKVFNALDVIQFDWDQGNFEHIQKHNVEYNECEDVFYNNPVFFADEKHSMLETRILAYGVTNQGRFLTLVFTIRQDKIRIVSARDQNKKEHLIYKTDHRKV